MGKFFNSDTGRKLLSLMLGLGIAGLFKMSCDNRSCIVYKGPDFSTKEKMIKYNPPNIYQSSYVFDHNGYAVFKSRYPEYNPYKHSY